MISDQVTSNFAPCSDKIHNVTLEHQHLKELTLFLHYITKCVNKGTSPKFN